MATSETVRCHRSMQTSYVVRSPGYRSLNRVWVNWREQRLVARLLTDCGLAGGSVLDVSCSYSRFSSPYIRLGIAVTGVDLHWDMVQLARQYGSSTPQKHMLCGTSFALPFADNTFDAVLCMRPFHHQYSDAERYRVLCELARVAHRYVLISFNRATLLHTWASFLAGKRQRAATLTDIELDVLAWASGLHRHCEAFLLRYIHMQTFAVLRKTAATPLAISDHNNGACAHRVNTVC